PTRSVLILNVNPEAPTYADDFDPKASYELKIDTNGDFEPDIAFHVLFAFSGMGQQTAMVYCATRAEAGGSGAIGEVIVHRAPVSFGREALIKEEGPYRFYAGFRSDPFHADRMGFANNMQWTRSDYFADKNV
ncbi:DUF4331 domain-containing protein, partial [Klebsiella pneumoniae]|uniref:DUF4331 domain-containing protein n=1 Tax=Klebsiella pneumoniae TaxID=573 RepID=UPI001E606C1A